MAKRQKVPSVAEIAAQMASQAAGVSPAPAKPSYAELESEVLSLRQQVENLRRQIADRPEKLLAADSRKGVVDTLKERGFNPAEKLIEMFEDMDLTNDQKIKILTELQAYVAPKLKSVEQHSTMDMTMTVVVKRFGKNADESAPKQIPIDIEAVASRTANQLPLATS